ncbi:hypothetical protein LG943_20425 [Streptomonospora sp. S1-112]|uniref:Uncharacterized protein n=1 Tax=Streptomonospora mangrovi TaxID=2883123 RepID=A0A9X3NQS7_9ACTN|nr:hypothetical protein [Streptomonospora mangrovi]
MESPPYRPSQALLVREFMRRAAWWADRFPDAGWPFYDYAGEVAPEVRADPAVIQQATARLPEVPQVLRLSCEFALHFAALWDSGVEVPELSGPFEPLMLVFERGSLVSFDSSGMIQVDVMAIKRGRSRDWLIEEPYVTLDISVLDEIDASAK